MTDEAKALGVRHAKITGKDMRDHWGPIVDRIADEISDPRDAIIETQAREIERLRRSAEYWKSIYKIQTRETQSQQSKWTEALSRAALGDTK